MTSVSRSGSRGGDMTSVCLHQTLSLPGDEKTRTGANSPATSILSRTSSVRKTTWWSKTGAGHVFALAIDPHRMHQKSARRTSAPDVEIVGLELVEVSCDRRCRSSRRRRRDRDDDEVRAAVGLAADACRSPSRGPGSASPPGRPRRAPDQPGVAVDEQRCTTRTRVATATSSPPRSAQWACPKRLNEEVLLGLHSAREIGQRPADCWPGLLQYS